MGSPAVRVIAGYKEDSGSSVGHPSVPGVGLVRCPVFAGFPSKAGAPPHPPLVRSTPAL